jgi:hypothetical protein
VISVGTISDRTTLRAQPADLQLAVICALTASMVREVACVREAGSYLSTLGAGGDLLMTGVRHLWWCA